MMILMMIMCVLADNRLRQDGNTAPYPQRLRSVVAGAAGRRLLVVFVL